MFGQDAFGVELNAMDRQGFMRQSHDKAVIGPGGDLKAFGKTFPFDDEGMIARRLKRRGQALEQATALVENC